ncbi:hypothetical protein [Lentilactobacillus parakefiri]|uniref:hypothetical protein n=1 Tax=Lentilactobacillus parakefiri TaxID=152332 RepID=UPI0014776A53|nr:hypothetical protein [Lentilactobacillus parakefiri]
MLLIAILGVLFLMYALRQRNRPAVKGVFIVIGILFLIFAVIIATPWGTDIISHMFQ